jgi:hypothetical protein
VTWTNPLEPAPPLPAEPAPPAPMNPPLPKEAPPLPEGKFGEIPDIDPDLAYLLPATQRVGGDGQNASFNARTGKFQQADGTNYAFDHLDEYNRAKRMAGKYFDVDNWEKNLREENAKRKRDEAMGITQDNKITKKDMVSPSSCLWDHAYNSGAIQEEEGRAEMEETGLASGLIVTGRWRAVMYSSRKGIYVCCISLKHICYKRVKATGILYSIPVLEPK